MRKNEKIIFITVDSKLKHQVCKAFLGHETKYKEKLNGKQEKTNK